MRSSSYSLALLILTSPPSIGLARAATAAESKQFEKDAKEQSPSFQQKRWTGTQGTSETLLQYDYVGPASQNLGMGKNGDIHEHYFDAYHLFMRHTLLAFLVQGGVEYQHMGFNPPPSALIPQRLDNAVGIFAIDFRWSKKDLLHIEGRPGLYTDFEGSGWDAFNTPLDVGYTRVVNNKFQWIVGFNVNTWRSARYLGGAGFRWQFHERWRIKAYMPTPAVEYVARPNLTLSLGADIRGESYRVGKHFGDDRGAPALNNAIVDYQEVRVGPGLSWNIRPTIALRLNTGYMVGRQFNYHNAGPKLYGSNAPYVSVHLQALFKLPGETLHIPLQNRIPLGDLFKYF